MQKNNKSLEEIEFPRGLIPEDRQSMILKCISFAENLPRGMTSFQIENFVLCNKDFPTDDSKYWQCKLEVISRIESALEILLGLNKDLFEYEKAESLIPKFALTKFFKLKRKIAQSSLQILKLKIILNRAKLKDTLRECEIFYNIVSSLAGKIKFSDINKEEQEESFWKAKAKFNHELDNIMKVGGYGNESVPGRSR